MDIKYTPLSEVTEYLKEGVTVSSERSWPFKLSGTKGEEIYLSVYESEIRAVLKQMSDIVEGF